MWWRSPRTTPRWQLVRQHAGASARVWIDSVLTELFRLPTDVTVTLACLWTH